MRQVKMRAEREQIADFVRAGNSIAAACERFDCSVQRVWRSCLENDVTVPSNKGRLPRASTYAIIAALIDGERQASIARRLGVSTQKVCIVAAKCREHYILRRKRDGRAKAGAAGGAVPRAV